jgi:putative ABC transport system permease protein
MISNLLTDLRFALRMLRKSPIFSLAIVFVIALGSGAVATIFSAMNAIVLRPLPGVARPDRLVSIRPARGDATEAEQGSYTFYSYLRDRTRTLEGATAWGRVSLTISAKGQNATVFGNLVSGNYFDVLGVRPALGRLFGADEDRAPGANPVIVVSHAFWSARLNAAPEAIGSGVLVNGTPFTLIGVAPPVFRGVYTGIQVDAWAPLMMQPVLRPRSNLADASWLWLFGRLRQGVERDAARAELSALANARFLESGQADTPRAVRAVSVTLLTGFPGGEKGPLLDFFSVLLGAAALVLLIAGVNVAAMLSARYTARGREMAVRAALGAGRGRLLGQLLTEILTLFVVGAGGGYLVAIVATAALEQIPLPANLPISLELSPDWRVFAFALGVSLLGGLTFGLAPALGAARRDVTAGLRTDSAGSGVRRSRLGRGLMVVQVALSLVLLVAAGLFVRALGQGRQIDPGFETTNVLTATLDSESWGYDEARARMFFRALRERVQALDRVAAASYTGRLPLMGGSSVDNVTIDGSELAVHYTPVDIDYFAAIGLPVIEGRTFDESIGRGTPRVVIVNETLARRLAPGGSAIGRTFRFRNEITTVIGVARDARYATLLERTPPFAYFPLAQIWHPAPTLIVRVTGRSDRFVSDLREAVLSIDRNLPPPRVVTLEQATSIVLLPQQAGAIVTAVLGGIGLLLAAAGLYGIMAFSAGRRTREIGIRIALGAGRGDVLRMMIGEGVRLGAIGIVAGLALAAATTRLMQNWLFGVSPLDVPTFAGTTAVFAAVALAASYLPARRAADADPVVALRTE